MQFFDEIKSIIDILKRHRAKTIAIGVFKKRIENFYEVWNIKIKPKIDLSNPTVTKSIDTIIKDVYKESYEKKQSNVNFLRSRMKQIYDLFFEKIIIPLKRPKQIIPPNFQMYVRQVKDSYEKDYFKEALSCARVDANRSVVVMSWIATVYNIYKKIENKGFRKFNKCYKKRYPKKRTKLVKKLDDLKYFQDSEILLVCEDIGIFDRDERSVLEKCLDLRNKCGHPSKYKPDPIRVSNFIHDITKIVFSK